MFALYISWSAYDCGRANKGDVALLLKVYAKKRYENYAHLYTFWLLLEIRVKMSIALQQSTNVGKILKQA